MTCSDCKKHEIVIKKYGLCISCYQKQRRRNLKTNPSQARFVYFRETEFIKNFFNHNEWTPQPASFHLSNNTSYTPDFYDNKRNTFIEVVGTRQAFHANKHKYVLLKTTFPKINFEVRDIKGNMVEEDCTGKYHWDQQPIEATAS